jgi:hypothetical protein
MTTPITRLPIATTDASTFLTQAQAAQAGAEAAAAGISSPYATRADFIAAQIAPVVTRSSFFVNGNTYAVVRDATGPIVQANGSRWRPDGDVTPQHFGAVGDGVADDTAAIKAAFLYAVHLHFPRGEYLVTGKNIVPPADMLEKHVTGEGMGVSVIRWRGDDGIASDGTGSANLFNFQQIASRADFVSFKNITIEGSHAINRSNVSAYPMAVHRASRVEFERVEVYHSRVFSITVRSADFASAKSCYVHHGARDGINFANCSRTAIIGNRCEYLDDDAIAVHNQVYRDCRGHVVQGNNIFMAQGIVALGVQAASITGNVMQYYFGRGINIETYAATTSDEEGVSVATGVVISSNVMMDPVDRAGLDARNTGNAAITVNGVSAAAGSEPVVPGTFGAVPYGFYRNASGVNPAGAIGLAIPPSGQISVIGNVAKRTMPLSGNFSTLGYGLFWMRDGELDYNMATSLTASTTRFLTIGGGWIDGLTVRGNMSVGLNCAVSINSSANISNCVIAENNFSDMSIRGIQFTPAVTGRTYDIAIINNVFDGDPYHRNANRQTLGRWAAASNLTCFLFQGARGVTLRGNVLKNWSRVTDFGVATVAAGGLIVWEGNDLWGDPTASGFSVDNGGIGEFPADLPDMGFVHVECDPAQPNFGEIYRQSRLIRSTATAISSGKFVQGEVVRVNSLSLLGTAPNRYLLRGYLRRTTGTSHVLNTDWTEIRAPME